MYHLAKVNTEIAELKNYRYAVQRYIVSLKQLTIVAYPFEKNDKSVFLTFRSVEYMQILTYWEHSPFVLASREACQTFMTELGLEFSDNYNLYSVELPTTKLNIICGTIKLSDTMPNI
jgi:hypothetical protein